MMMHQNSIRHENKTITDISGGKLDQNVINCIKDCEHTADPRTTVGNCPMGSQLEPIEGTASLEALLYIRKVSEACSRGDDREAAEDKEPCLCCSVSLEASSRFKEPIKYVLLPRSRPDSVTERSTDPALNTGSLKSPNPRKAVRCHEDSLGRLG
jgi:hypothetical protein